MSDDNDVHALLGALKYVTAERMKSAQRKFSAARNTITEDALSSQFKGFFSPEEQEILTKAGRILGEFKNKIEHAKEIRARQEQKRAAELSRRNELREKLLTQNLPGLSSVSEHLENVLLHLALQDNCQSISGAYFGSRIGYLETDLGRVLSGEYEHLKAMHIAPDCRSDSIKWLSENLWAWDIEPDPERLEQVMQVYQSGWRAAAEKRYESFLGRYCTALLTEFDQHDAALRAKAALQRRSKIKVVK